MQNVISFVLGGGRGKRLYPLTKYRSKPAVPLAGKYRLIDIPLSNCINSGFNKMYVLTQFLSVSLHRHIRQTYRFDHFNGGFVEILAAQQMNGNDVRHDGHLCLQSRYAGRMPGEDRLPRFRQGDFSGLGTSQARNRPSLRRLLGRHRYDPRFLRSESELGEQPAAVRLSQPLGTDLQPPAV